MERASPSELRRAGKASRLSKRRTQFDETSTLSALRCQPAPVAHGGEESYIYEKTDSPRRDREQI